MSLRSCGLRVGSSRQSSGPRMNSRLYPCSYFIARHFEVVGRLHSHTEFGACAKVASCSPGERSDTRGLDRKKLPQVAALMRATRWEFATIKRSADELAPLSLLLFHRAPFRGRRSSAFPYRIRRLCQSSKL